MSINSYYTPSSSSTQPEHVTTNVGLLFHTAPEIETEIEPQPKPEAQPEDY